MFHFTTILYKELIAQDKKVFQKQKMMRKVIYPLIPIYIAALYFYGLRLLFLSVFVFGFGILTEFIMEKHKKKKVSEAVLVTCLLYVLSLPAHTPWWVATIGIIFGVLFGKEVFGGFGKNIFNPAIVGRLFVYISFPGVMTTGFTNPGGFPMGSDAVTSATPLAIIRQGGQVDLLRLATGWHASSFGEGCVILIVIAALYLIFTKTASWQIMLSMVVTGFVLSFAFQLAGFKQALPALPAMLSGSFLFVAVFMATDPVSAPKKPKSKWVYGILIGAVAVIVRTFSLFPEGTSFGILFANTFASLIDELFTKKK